ncbi:MAG: uroporphyrinogen decarboxylase family protein [Candidatus Hydrothermarchaeales archaeon]
MKSIVLDAIKGKRTDRVPVAPLVTVAHASRIYGIKPFEYVLNSENYANAQIYAKKFYGYDWVWSHQPFQGVSREERDKVVVQGDEAILTLEVGTRFKIYSNNPPQIIRPAITSKDQVKRLEIPDPYIEERMEPIRLMLEKEDFVCGNVRCPFTLASTFLYDLESLLIDMKVDQNFVFELLDFALEYCAEYAKAQVKEGAHAIFTEDPSASPSLISPNDYRRFALPYERALFKKIELVPVIFHICGNITPIMEDMVGAGADCISVEERVDMEALHKKAPVWGNVSSSLLVRGSKDEVGEISKGIVELGRGVVLSSGCVVPGNAKEENMREMVNASHGRN